MSIVPVPLYRDNPIPPAPVVRQFVFHFRNDKMCPEPKCHKYQPAPHYSNRRALTVVVHFDLVRIMMGIGKAECSWKDQFCRRRGREIAAGRAPYKLYFTLVSKHCTHRDCWNIARRTAYQLAGLPEASK